MLCIHIQCSFTAFLKIIEIVKLLILSFYYAFLKSCFFNGLTVITLKAIKIYQTCIHIYIYS